MGLTPHVPNVKQFHAYTDGHLPELDQVEFLPGGGPGRPRKGKEKITAKTEEAVREVLHSDIWSRYNKIIVKFKGDCHRFEARVDIVHGKRMLVVEGLGIITSTF